MIQCIDIVLIFFHVLVLQNFFGSGGKKTTALAGARGHKIIALSISSYLQTQ